MILIQENFKGLHTALQYVIQALTDENIKYVNAEGDTITICTERYFCNIDLLSDFCQVTISPIGSDFWNGQSGIPIAYRIIKRLIRHNINNFSIGQFSQGEFYIRIDENIYEF